MSPSPLDKRKLTPEKAQEIRERVKNGERKSHMAREYDISPSMVTMIVRGHLYKNK